MAAAGNWVWERGGSYFGVPLHNYFGWLLTTFIVYLGAGSIWREESRDRRVMTGCSAVRHGAAGPAGVDAGVAG